MERDIIDALVGKSNYWRYRSDQLGKREDLINLALKAHKQAIQIEDKLRHFYPDKSSRLRISRDRTNRIEEALFIANELWHLNPSDSLADQILYLMEKNRAQELQSELKRQNLSLKLGNKAKDLEKAYRISKYAWNEAKRNLLLAQSLENQNQQNIDKFKFIENNCKIQLKRTKEKLDLILEMEFPGYLRLKSHPNILHLRELQTTLSEEEGFISFFNSSSCIYILYISRENISFNQIPLTKPLLASIDS